LYKQIYYFLYKFTARFYLYKQTFCEFSDIFKKEGVYKPLLSIKI